MGSSFLLICKLALTMFPSLAPPVAFNSVMVKFSMSSGILNKKKKKFKQRNVSQLRITCTLKFSLQFTSSGTEKRVRFFWYSPSLKVMVPWRGLTSLDWAGSSTHETDTSSKLPLFLTTEYEAEGEIKETSPSTCAYTWHKNAGSPCFHEQFPKSWIAHADQFSVIHSS